VKIHLIAVGNRMPRWVAEGYEHYAKRLPDSFRLVLHEIDPIKRGKSISAARVKTLESARILNAIPKGSSCIALDERGKERTTKDLATEINRWMQAGRDMSLLVGGADGLAPECLERASSQWSLSAMTLPHGLVRVVLAEQLYRAWSLLNSHPYHRE
jgi:23S rRNA (pseudouridine1915-N3)-methyltransferase